MVCLSRPYPFKFFKGCLSQMLLSPFLNPLSQKIFPKLRFFKYLFCVNNVAEMLSRSKCCTVFKMCLTILGYALTHKNDMIKNRSFHILCYLQCLFLLVPKVNYTFMRINTKYNYQYITISLVKTT